MAEVFDFGLQQHKIKMDGKFFENNLFAVAGETGRRLEVQLLDSDNLVQNTTGISLRLNADVAGQATYAEATLVDATKGLYYVDLPNGMLIAPGNWQFQWQIIGTSGEKLHSFAFTGSIGSNLSEGGTEATNFYLNIKELMEMQEYITRELAEIRQEFLEEKIIKPVDTSFFESSSNKFDSSTVSINTSLSPDSQPLVNANTTNFALSDFIRITELEKTVFKNARAYSFYRADKSALPGSYVALTGSYAGHVANNPAGSFWVRFAWYLPNEPLNTQQVNIGDKLLAYEEPWIIPVNYKGNQRFDRSDLNFFIGEAIQSKNRHVPSSIIKGYFLNQTTGGLSAGITYNTYEIDVVPGEQITLSTHNRSAFYLKSGGFVPGSGLFNNTVGVPLTITVPLNAYKMKYSLTTTYADGNFQIESGPTATSYVNPGFKMPELDLSDKLVGYFDYINLPSKLYSTIGEELKIYNGNILKDKESEFNIDWDCSSGKQMGDGFVITPTATGNLTLTINLYRKSTLIKSKATSIIVSNKRTTPITVLEIGDSTTVAARNAYAVKRMKDKLGNNLNLIGKMGTAPILYEGRGGWKAETYRTDTMYYDDPNYFYNPTTGDFDFSYYMTQNGFSGVDVVILNLGINDVFGQKDDNGVETATNFSITNTDFLINSILAYNPMVKIALNIAIPPHADQDVFGNTPDVALFQTQWRAKYNNFIYTSKIIEYYQGKHDLIPIHAVIDTINNFTDHVHPKEAGYYQIGDQKVNYLNSL